MRKSCAHFICVFLCIILSVSLCACSGAQKTAIKNTLSSFETACHKMDVDSMLDCIDPDIAKPIQMGLAIAGSITGNDYSDVIGELAQRVLGEVFNSEEVLSSFELSDFEINVNGKKATVECSMHFELNGSDFEQDVSFSMKYVDDEWYISGVNVQREK